MRLFVTYIGLQLLVYPAVVMAQNAPRTNPDFLLINNSARSLALGEATVAMNSYSGASHINPATIGIHGFIQGTSPLSWKEDDRLRLMRPGTINGIWFSMPEISYRVNNYALGLSFLKNDIYSEELEFISDHKEQALTASFAYRLADRTWIGAGISYIYSRRGNGFTIESDDDTRARNISLDLGFYHNWSYQMKSFYVAPSLGWSLTDFGPTFSYSPSQAVGGQEIVYALPMTMRFGFSVEAGTQKQWHNRPLVRLSLHGNFSKELGRTDDEGDPFGPIRSLVSSWGKYQRSDGKTIKLANQIVRHQGVELSFLDILYGRIGYINRPSYNYDFDTSSFGFGIDLFYVALDYARVSYKRDEGGAIFADDLSIWQITGRIPIGGGTAKRNFWPTLFKGIR